MTMMMVKGMVVVIFVEPSGVFTLVLYDQTD
jgi:hypothetical protein